MIQMNKYISYVTIKNVKKYKVLMDKWFASVENKVEELQYV